MPLRKINDKVLLRSGKSGIIRSFRQHDLGEHNIDYQVAVDYGIPVWVRGTDIIQVLSSLGGPASRLTPAAIRANQRIDDPQLRRSPGQIAAMTLGEARRHLLQLKEDVRKHSVVWQRLITEPVHDPSYDEMYQKGQYWQDFERILKSYELEAGSIVKLSKFNLANAETLYLKIMSSLDASPLSYISLLERLVNFPWVIKHNTKPDHIDKVKTSQSLYSATEKQRRGLAVDGGTKLGASDQLLIHNEDFVFFRLSYGNEPAHSRFGPECLVFAPNQLFETGWVTLYDMLSPNSTEQITNLPDFHNDLSAMGTGKSAFSGSVRSMYVDHMNISLRYPQQACDAFSEFQMHRAQIAFYGRDIRRGLALSTLIELLRIGSTGLLDVAMKYIAPGDANNRIFLNVFRNLFWIEAKIPRTFHYSQSELLDSHSNVPYTRNANI